MSQIPELSEDRGSPAAACSLCNWLVLATGLFKLCFKKPIDKQEIAAFNLMTASAKNEDDMGFLLTREGFTKSALAAPRPATATRRMRPAATCSPR